MDNLLKNPTFSGLHTPFRVEKGRYEIAAYWLGAWADNTTVSLTPVSAKSGLRVRKPSGNVTIYQEIPNTAFDGRPKIEVAVTLRASVEAPLAWFGLIRQNRASRRFHFRAVPQVSSSNGILLATARAQLNPSPGGARLFFAMEIGEMVDAIEIENAVVTIDAQSLPAVPNAEHFPSENERPAGQSIGSRTKHGPPSLPVRGQIISVRGQRLIGWAKREGSPRPVGVEILADGQVVGTAMADRRLTLLETVDTIANHGLTFQLPDRLADGQDHVITLREGETERPVDIRPKRVRIDGTTLLPSSGSLKPNGAIATPAVPGNISRRAIIVSDDGWRAQSLATLASPFFAVTVLQTGSADTGRNWGPGVQVISLDNKEDRRAAALRALERIVPSEPIACIFVAGAGIDTFICAYALKHQLGCPIIADLSPLWCKLLKDSRSTQISHQPDSLDRTIRKFLDGADILIARHPAVRMLSNGILVRYPALGGDRPSDSAARISARPSLKIGFEERVITILGTVSDAVAIGETIDAVLTMINVPTVVITSDDSQPAARKLERHRVRALELRGRQEQLCQSLQIADLIIIVGEVDGAAAEDQVYDAIFRGCPILVVGESWLCDLIGLGSIVSVSDPSYLERILSVPAREETGWPTLRGELGIDVNAARLLIAVKMASDVAPKWSWDIQRELERISASATGLSVPVWTELGRAPAIVDEDRPLELVCFWKQNDSDIYGRRSDMLVKYLIQGGYASRVVHFDAPISASWLDAVGRQGIESGDADHYKLIYAQTVRRILCLSDGDGVFRRTFLYKDAEGPTEFLGRALPEMSGYANFVRETLKECGINSPTALVWPIAPGFEVISREIDFRLILADIVDDERAFESASKNADKIAKTYRQTLAKAHLAFANCATVQERFSAMHDNILLVPNGADTFKGMAEWPCPSDLAELPRPIIGYSGNLDARLDTVLIRKIAAERPNWTIVLMGSTHANPGIRALFSDLSNVHLIGVRPYETALRYIRRFNVAIIPHLRNDLSTSMNPLKAYIYAALGVPIVSTAVDNLEDFVKIAAIVTSHEDFIAALQDAMNRSAKRPPLTDHLRWSNRVKTMIAEVQRLISSN